MLDPSAAPLVELCEVVKTYHLGGNLVQALRGLSLRLLPGEYLAIMGPSGSGKSTLLNLLGCLDRPTQGRYFLGGQDVSGLDDDTLSLVRGKRIGFVFQSFNLIEQLTVQENIEVPLFYQGVPPQTAAERSIELATRLGLGARLRHRPNELSGGQIQRVALARALANDPLLILADEPTGNLDSTTGAEVMTLLDGLSAAGTTIVIVTHDPQVSKHAHRVIYLRDGRIEREERH